MKWSKEMYGDFLKIVATLEDLMRVKEAQLGINSNEQNRVELRKQEVELTRCQKIKKDY